MTECIFCGIRQGTQDASIVYQDDRVTAFMDIRPLNRGHVVVIPNSHAADLEELNPEAAGDMMRAAQKIAGALKHSDVKCEAINLWMADGKAAGQTVFHVHLHVVPRYSDDGFGLKFPPNYGQEPHRAELDDLATKIRTGLEKVV
jgi:histidine triad (HIT) family protein